VYPASLESLNTISGSTGVSYTGSAPVSNTEAFSCTGVFPSLVGEMFASTSAGNNLQTANVTIPASVTLDAMVEPVNSETSYSYPSEGSYTGVAAPAANVEFLEGTNVVGTGALSANGTLASATITNPAAGTHTYTAEFVGDTNYAALSFGSVTVNVTAGPAAQLAYTAGPASSLVYGVAPGTVTVAVEDAAGNATTSTAAVTLIVSGPNGYSASYTVNAVSGVATFTLSASLPGVGSYSYVASSAGLTSTAAVGENVSAATLTVLAQAASRIFGAPNPAFGYAISGFVNGDSAAVLSGAPVLSTTALRNSPAGAYPIAVGAGTLAAANYVFTTSGSTLTINGGAPQMIVFRPLPNVPAGASYQLAASDTSGLPVTYTVSGPATIAGATISVTGPGLVQVTASNAGNGNYAAAAGVMQSFTAE
jgi:hypothetical protein